MRYLLILLLIFIQSISIAQITLPATTLSSIELIKKEYDRTLPLIDQTQFDQKYISCLAKVSESFDKNNLPENVLFGSRIGYIITLKIPKDQIEVIYELEGVNYLEFASKIVPNVERAVKDLRADSVQKGLFSNSPYTGKNVIIGITDWGFDYTHPMFYDTSLNETRILSVWDQFKTSGPAPSGFNYGTEYCPQGCGRCV